MRHQKTNDQLILYENTIIQITIQENSGQIQLVKRAKCPTSRDDITLIENEFYSIKKQGYSHALNPIKEDVLDSQPKTVYAYENGWSRLEELFSKKHAIEELVGILEIVCSAIESFHKQCLVIHHVTPQNILINLRKRRVVFINLYSLSAVENPIPEQVYRALSEEENVYYPVFDSKQDAKAKFSTDLFALGKIMYKLTTGMELYATSGYPSPCEVNHHIPRTLSDIIIKMLSLKEEVAYQSYIGVKNDINELKNKMENNGGSQYFFAGAHNTSPIFKLSNHIVGRSEEIQRIRAFLKSDQTGLLSIEGESGVGKTTLIIEALNAVKRDNNAAVLIGKYEKHNIHAPLFGIKRTLSKYINTFSSEVYETYKNQLREVVGDKNVALLKDLLSSQTHSHEADALMDPHEYENRSTLALIELLKLMSKDTHFYLFLDDIQWCDLVTIKTLNAILEERVPLHIILSFRSEEKHHLMQIEGADTLLNKAEAIQLMPLSQKEVTHYISQQELCNQDRVQELGALLHDKTSGNPFHLKELLQKLNEEEILYFNNTQQVWDCELSNVKAYKVASNVVDILCDKIDIMPDSSKAILKTAAVLGYYFNLNRLQQTMECSLLELLAPLQQAINNRIVTNLDHLENSINLDVLELKEGQDVKFCFTHDKVHQTILSTIQDEEKERLHYKIGLDLLRMKKSGLSNEPVFGIVHHLNQVPQNEFNLNQRLELAKLNFDAGLIAMDQSEYSAAKRYYQKALKSLENQAEDYPDLQLSINYQLAQTYFLSSEQEKSEVLYAELLKTNDKAVRTHVYEKKTILHTLKQEYEEAIDYGMLALNELDFSLPKHPSLIRVLYTYLSLRMRISNSIAQDLLSLPPSNNSRIISIISITSQLSIPTYETNQNLMLIGALKVFGLSLKEGHTTNSPFAYFCFGFMMILFGNYKLGLEIGEASLELLKRTNNQNLAGKLNFSFSILMGHWVYPLSDVIAKIQDARNLCLQTGNLTFAGLCSWNTYLLHFYNGRPFNELEMPLNEHIQFAYSKKMADVACGLEMIRLCIATLSGKSSLENMDAAVKEVESKTVSGEVNPNLGANIWIHKAEMHYLLGETKNAIKALKRAVKILEYVRGQHIYTYYYLYQALCLCKEDTNYIQKQVSKIKLKLIINKYKTWAEHGPTVYQSPLALLQAKYKELKGEKAHVEYAKALQAADTYATLKTKALIYEEASQYYIRVNDKVSAKKQLRAAVYLYHKWGATLKETQLKQLFKKIFKEDPFV